jgi:phosphonate transport system substrate-binding protein
MLRLHLKDLSKPKILSGLVLQFFLSVFLVSLSTLTSSCSNNHEVGDRSRPLKLFFIPSDDTQKIGRSARLIAEDLMKRVSQKLYGKDEGFYIRETVPSSYIAVIEAFGSNRADLAAVDTFNYVFAKDIKKYPVEAALNIVRGENERTYKAQILVPENSPIKTLQDLNGKKFAFVDPTSPAGYILPSLLFEKHGIQLGEKVFAGRHDTVVTMIYQGQVEAGATYHSPPREVVVNGQKKSEIRDARSKVLTQFPDVESKIRILDFTDSIPNGPWILRTNIYKDSAKYVAVKKAIQESLIEFSQTPEGKKALEELYNISALVPATDQEFENIRTLFSQSAERLSNLIHQPKKTAKR